MLKALPFDEEISGAGCGDAASYLAKLKKEDRTAYRELVATRATSWGNVPPQPVHRCVAHTLAIIITKVEEETAGEDNLKLSPHEVKLWMTEKKLART